MEVYRCTYIEGCILQRERESEGKSSWMDGSRTRGGCKRAEEGARVLKELEEEEE